MRIPINNRGRPKASNSVLKLRLKPGGLLAAMADRQVELLLLLVLLASGLVPPIALFDFSPDAALALTPIKPTVAARPSHQSFQLPANIPQPELRRDSSVSGRYAAMEAADTASSDYRDYFGSRTLAPGEYVWRAEPRNRHAIHLVVSIEQQRAYVYEGPVLLAATTVSTGRRGHRTPSGIFPITEKYELKLSNLYDEAPMHFMQRLTNDGIALHSGNVPGYPASHGCIRMPAAFAEKLFALTGIGTAVLISA